jgi:hypothetical protein
MYGVKIPFEGSFLWIVDADLQPILFDSIEGAKELLMVWPVGTITEYKETDNES